MFSKKTIWAKSNFANMEFSTGYTKWAFPSDDFKEGNRFEALIKFLAKEQMLFAEKGYVDLEKIWETGEFEGVSIKKVAALKQIFPDLSNPFKGRKLVSVFLDLSLNIAPPDTNERKKPALTISKSGNYFFYGKMPIWCNVDLFEDNDPLFIPYEELRGMTEEELKQRHWVISTMNCKGFLKEEDGDKKIIQPAIGELQNAQEQDRIEEFAAIIKEAVVFMIIEKFELTGYKNEKTGKISTSLDFGNVDYVVVL